MKEIVWATDPSKYSAFADLARETAMLGVRHWSRLFEYPFAIIAGNFKATDRVLDAAGGDSPFQVLLADRVAMVLNVDQSHDLLKKGYEDLSKYSAFSKVVQQIGDLRNLWWLPEGSFDKATCLSVLEHIDRPLEVLKELWRVLRSGGRLVVTLDVASYARWNHTIDLQGAKEIAAHFGLQLPPITPDVLFQSFPEIDRQPGDPESVRLCVLCFYADKE